MSASDDDRTPYQSRLKVGVTKGIGSAYPQNQTLAGVKNPQEAARLAGMGEEEHRRAEESQEERQKEFDALIEDLLVAISEGIYSPPINPTPSSTEQWRKALVSSPLPSLRQWGEKAKAAYDERMVKEDESILQETLGGVGIDPGDPLYNPMMDRERRARIEKDLPSIDFDALIFSNFYAQDIRLRPNLVITIRTITGLHALWMSNLMWRESSNPAGMSVQHLRHLTSLMQLAVGLDAINGRPIGPDISRFSEDTQSHREGFESAVKERLAFVTRLPTALSDDFIIQQVWFNGRVAREIAGGDLLRKVGNS